MKFENGRLNFYAGNAGWRNISFELNGILSSTLEFTLEEDTAVAESGIHRERLVFEELDNNALIVTRYVTNITGSKLEIETVSDGILDETAQVSVTDMHEYSLRYMHSSNMRSERFPDSRPEYPFIRPVPYEPVHFNIGECNNFPAFILCDESYQSLLVEGDLNQTVFERSWRLGLQGPGEKSKLLRTCHAEERYLMSEQMELEPQQEVEVSRVYYQILENVHPQVAFDGYIAALNEQYQMQGGKSPMLHGAVFCTWNYGTLNNINEELILSRAISIRERLPECSHFLIDDGFQRGRNGRNGPLDTFYPNPSTGYDPELFPNGMKYVADKLSETGFTPCIWLSPAIFLDSQLAQDHPEWLLCDKEGDPALLGKSTFLDLSVPEARDFFLKVLDALFVEWGYRGIKFDFMTQWFTLEKACFRNGGSGVQWRDFVFLEIRKRIGEDGLFMTCIAMSMGNPFPGLNADCYRCGCDIHDGTWAEQLKACKATLPQIIIEGRNTFLLNMDSAGFGKNPLHEQIFRLTWIFITQGMIELGGPVESMPQSQIDMWRRMLKIIDRGHKVTCLDQRAFTGEGQPQILKVDYPADSITRKQGIRAHIAFFNWEDQLTPVGGTREYLGIDERHTVTDFWSGEIVEFNELIVRNLPAHSAVMFEVRV